MYLLPLREVIGKRPVRSVEMLPVASKTLAIICDVGANGMGTSLSLLLVGCCVCFSETILSTSTAAVLLSLFVFDVLLEASRRLIGEGRVLYSNSDTTFPNDGILCLFIDEPMKNCYMCSIELGKRRRVCNGLWGTIFPTDSIHIEASEVLEMYQHIIDTK